MSKCPLYILDDITTTTFMVLPFKIFMVFVDAIMLRFITKRQQEPDDVANRNTTI